MQKAGTSAYLPMAQSGLALTTDMLRYDDKTKKEISDYTDEIKNANANIVKLQGIKLQVDAIVTSAKIRRDAERAKNGLPPASNSCN
jgi:hypothetical protein